MAEVYDYDVDSWTPVATLPLVVSSHRAVLVPKMGEIYTVGGAEGNAYKYDLSADSWTAIPFFPIPGAMKPNCLAVEGWEQVWRLVA